VKEGKRKGKEGVTRFRRKESCELTSSREISNDDDELSSREMYKVNLPKEKQIRLPFHVSSTQKNPPALRTCQM